MMAGRKGSALPHGSQSMKSQTKRDENAVRVTSWQMTQLWLDTPAAHRLLAATAQALEHESEEME
jgi:hypothetical protein